MADTTTTTESPALRVATMRWATRLMPSASATEDPPYFCTTRATGPPLLRSGCWLGSRLESIQRAAQTGPACVLAAVSRAGGWSAGGALLRDVQPGMRDDGVQRPHGRAAVQAPVVHVRVLPPPQGLGRAASLVVLEPVDKVSRHRG